MKKQILSTSAIALGVAMAAPASAQEWDMDWGGFFNTHVGIVDVSGNGIAAGSDFDGVNIFMNREIIFSPSVTLDNGLTFGVNIQMEGDNGSAPSADIDETYMTISSDTLGRIILGNENSAGYLSMVAAPQVGSMPINSLSITGFLPLNHPNNFRRAGISSYTEVQGNNDVSRITYFTPSFNGLTLGVSYAPSGNVNAANSGPVNFNGAGLRDIFDIGISYSQSFNGVDLDLGARWGTAEARAIANGPTTDPETFGIGGSISVSGFTFGIGYAENDADGVGGAGDEEGLSVGVAYDIAGPWTVGLEGYFGEYDNGPNINEGEYTAYKLAASRSLGAGVSWDVYYVYAESENVGGAEVEGNVLATAINLSF